MNQTLKKREPLLTEQYFDETLQLSYEFIAEAKEDALLPSYQMRHDLLYLSLYNEWLEVIELKYSRGYAIQELRADFLALVDSLETFRRFPDPDGDPEGMFFNGEQDEYMQAVELLSLGLLLRVEAGVFQRLVAALGLNGQDFVLEWLAGRRLPDRPRTTQLLFPKTYARLRDAIQAPRDIQAAVLKSFLAGWYESLDTVWYECHRVPGGGGFTGYWCWEAAAVACFLGADDGELRAMRYYPADLADYAYGRKLQPTTDAG